MKILLIEDDELLGASLAKLLRANYYLVDLAVDGQAGLELTTTIDYDLIALAVSMPKLDGMSLCQQLRKQGYEKIILLLTADSSDESAIAGFEAGADDYLIKPFPADVLLAKIRTLLRRSGAFVSPKTEASTNLLTWGKLQFDLDSGRVTIADQAIALTATEYHLLELLLRNPERIFSRSVILDRLWGFDEAPTDRAINTHIKDLRKKLKVGGLTEEMIETVYGMGYRLKAAPHITDSPSTQNHSRFQALLDKRIAVLHQAKAELRLGKLEPALQQAAQQEAHKLAGSLASFGYPNGSKIARSLEHLLIKSDLALLRDSSQFSELVTTLEQEISKQPNTSKIPLNPLTSSPKPLQVLIIDDDIALTERLETETEQWGFFLTRIETPTAARSYLTLAMPDVVLLDLSFPETEEDGLSLLQGIKTQWPTVPIIVFTGRGSLSDRLTASRLGAQQFLQKPATTEQVFQAVSQALNKPKKAEAKILIVDDDPSILDWLTNILTPWGLDVTTLSEPQQFWEVLTTVLPDLILIDLEMPQISGLDLTQVVRQDVTWGDVPILVVTAHTDAESLQQAFAVGADDFITKPVLGPELVTRILSRIQCDYLHPKKQNIAPDSGINSHDP
ncbi:MAG: response regulator [Snowella sp.]|nr:response regulator [Snowella sp.]